MRKTPTKTQIKAAIEKAKITVPLEPEDLDLLISALDSHEYWQLSDESERSNGFVILPEDRMEPVDPRNEDDEEEEEEEDENHDAIRACRALAEKLRAHKP